MVVKRDYLDLMTKNAMVVMSKTLVCRCNYGTSNVSFGGFTLCGVLTLRPVCFVYYLKNCNGVLKM